MTMISILASVLLSLPGAFQPDPNAIMQQNVPRQQQNMTPGPIAELPAGTEAPTLVGEFGNRRIIGVASNRFGRVFVAAAPGAPGEWLVAERMVDGSLVPYPPVDPSKPLVLTSVTAIQIDPQERLWIVDSANPDGKGVVRTPMVPGQFGAAAGPKLVCVELSNNTVSGAWAFAESIAPANSLLAGVCTESNDRRSMTRDAEGREAGMDPKIERGNQNWAYISDAGGGAAGGAILAVNLNLAKVRRLLAGHVSTRAEPGFVATVGGVGGTELKGDAAPTALNADAIVYDSANELVYWQPLGSRTLYSIKTAFIHDTGLPRDELAKKVNTLGPTVMASSMQIDAMGVIYFAAVERDAIVSRAVNGTLSTFAHAPGLSWVDGLSFVREPGGRRGMAWMPASRAFGPNTSGDPYKIWQVYLNPPTSAK